MASEYANVTIRNVKEEALQELRVEAAREKKKLGEAVSEAIEYWVHHRKIHTKKKGKFTDLKPVDFGLGSEHSSTDIDRVVYG